MSINKVKMNFYKPKVHKWLITVLLLWLQRASNFAATVRNNGVKRWNTHLSQFYTLYRFKNVWNRQREASSVMH